MKRQRRQFPLIHEMEFHNLSERNLSIEDVFIRIARFMAQDPRAVYNIIVATDAQCHTGHTVFDTCIVSHRVGKCAWVCYRRVILPREINSVKEKLSLETSFSQEIAALFDNGRRNMLEDIILPYIDQGADIKYFVDIDAGTDTIKNKTAAYVSEMVERVESMGLTARVKPEAAMVGLVDRKTKQPYRFKISATAT
ncbi:ribonuclease H-like YkuK family protein [Paenibacillus alkalitolerans]|uniref:ribonuclease H-like YkuK family protein n=1 Tax=Paenibacillus alkalitolerans TaxID=2799335 RepID=UPI0018F3BB60|nr:ribonuclease H-like YkuK family protein [Paenibacillus alkalitolerans]